MCWPGSSRPFAAAPDPVPRYAADFETMLAAGETLVIDGGLATQCEAQGCDISTPLWSAALLHSNPGAIIAAHRAYLDAGADIIISASYQASREGFAREGIGAAEADALIAGSLRLAAEARDAFLGDNPGTDRRPLVAASVGPYGATLHDGSEYGGDYGVSSSALRDFRATRLGVLDGDPADLLACETIPSFTEAAVLAGLLRSATLPAWVSFSCRDAMHISDGTPIAEVAALFSGHPRVLAIGVNCTPPRFITPLIMAIRAAAPDRAIVVYPNSGERYAAADNSWSGSRSSFDWAAAASEWRDAGAALIGGCCRVGPAEIAAIARSL